MTEKDNDFKWYIIHTHSGFESKVVALVKEEIKKKNLIESFDDFLIPTQKTLEIKKGKKIEGEKKFYPGYILIKMIMNDDTWHLVKKISKVSGFLGAANKPVPLRKEEAERILGQIKEGGESVVPTITFEIGETVKVSDGPFASFNGVVEEVDSDRSRLKVAVSIFGRATPVELEYTQVEKS
ncbi:MAG: transcription termination/antitermination protein NusG [Rickettsiales bacterium TMED251]|nr:MAG: transcription termination/antitermination protein NusG [Rickettsiales bacterium TMED251]